MTEQDRTLLLSMQRNELTEAVVYEKMAALQKEKKNTDILRRIGADELRHAGLLAELTGAEVQPNHSRVFRCMFTARVFGLSFGLKRMEKGEAVAGKTYAGLQERFPVLKRIAEEEESHENALIKMLNDERLSYMGSIVLGLNDALVELTGALAGFTFALPGTRMVAVTGLITGLSASMSMAASGYLSARAENNPAKPPLKSACYTGLAYVATVCLLVTPFFLLPSSLMALCSALAMAFGIIALFNYYISVACDEPFWARFLEMAGLSGGVACISFLIGLALNHFVPA